jgi:rubrerythrin
MDPQLAQHAPHLTLSASALELAEVAHAAQGQRLKEARELQTALEGERARKEAKAEEQAAEASRKLHAQLQAQLQQLAAEDAAAAQEFAKRREKMAWETLRSPIVYRCSKTTHRPCRPQSHQPHKWRRPHTLLIFTTHSRYPEELPSQVTNNKGPRTL